MMIRHGLLLVSQMSNTAWMTALSDPHGYASSTRPDDAICRRAGWSSSGSRAGWSSNSSKEQHQVQIGHSVIISIPRNNTWQNHHQYPHHGVWMYNRTYEGPKRVSKVATRKQILVLPSVNAGAWVNHGSTKVRPNNVAVMLPLIVAYPH